MSIPEALALGAAVSMIIGIVAVAFAWLLGFGFREMLFGFFFAASPPMLFVSVVQIVHILQDQPIEGSDLDQTAPLGVKVNPAPIIMPVSNQVCGKGCQPLNGTKSSGK